MNDSDAVGRDACVVCGAIAQEEVCPDCNGDGTDGWGEDWCGECAGHGTVIVCDCYWEARARALLDR